jgi:hypothetical protein
MSTAENNSREELFIPEKCRHITISNLPLWLLKSQEFIANLREKFDCEIQMNEKGGIIGIVRNEVSALTGEERRFLENYYKMNPDCDILIR